MKFEKIYKFNRRNGTDGTEDMCSMRKRVLFMVEGKERNTIA